MSSIWDSGWVIHDSEDMYPTKNPKRGIMGIVNDECLPHHWPTVSCCLPTKLGCVLTPSSFCAIFWWLHELTKNIAMENWKIAIYS